MSGALRIAMMAYMLACVTVGGFRRTIDLPVLQETDAAGDIVTSGNFCPALEIISGLASLNSCIVPDFSCHLPVPAVFSDNVYSEAQVLPNLDRSLLRPPII